MNYLLCLVCLVTATYMPQAGAQPCNKSGVGYEGLEYFSIEYPYTSAARPNDVCPEKPEVINTKFLLYTRRSDQPQILDARRPAEAREKLTNCRPGPTIFLIHGARSENDSTPWLPGMKDQLLKRGDYNVFIVDWSGGSSLVFGGSSGFTSGVSKFFRAFYSAVTGDSSFIFRQAAANSRVVAVQITNLIKHLNESCGVTPGDIHLIGHSIGAHIAGEVGRRIPRIKRISGLDPCGPRYTGTDTDVRLDKTDADFVDIIHTNMAKSVFKGIGTTDHGGHADYYPNGGSKQPGCGFFESVSGGLTAISNYLTCDHSRAHELYNETINSECQFNSYPCASEADFEAGLCQSCGDGCPPMGFYADQHIPPGGQNFSYYLKTADKPPFCIDNATTSSG